MGLAAGVTDAYAHLRHLVFSRTLPQRPDSGVEFVAEDPVAVVQRLKREGGKDIWLVGGGELAGSLYGEIDRLIVKLSPLTVGCGIPLFGRNAVFVPSAWQLIDHTVLEGGAVFLTYDRSSDSPQAGEGAQ